MRKFVLIFSLLFIVPVISSCNTINSKSSSDTIRSSGLASSIESRPDYMKDPENLDQAIALRLREDYLAFIKSSDPGYKQDLNKIYVQQYFGTYSGCEVVYMGSDLQHHDAERPVTIAGYTIVFRDGQLVYVHKDSTFYEVKDAYDAGYITKSDIYQIGLKVGIEFKENYPNP